MNLSELRRRLIAVTEEMTALIRVYELHAFDPLDVIEHAKKRIKLPNDYVRFLELSLQGRILADEGERLMKIEQSLN